MTLSVEQRCTPVVAVQLLRTAEFTAATGAQDACRGQ